MRDRLREGVLVGCGLAFVAGYLPEFVQAPVTHFVHAQFVFEPLQSQDGDCPGRNHAFAFEPVADRAFAAVEPAAKLAHRIALGVVREFAW